MFKYSHNKVNKRLKYPSPFQFTEILLNSVVVQDIKGGQYQDLMCDTFLLFVVEIFKQYRSSFRAQIVFYKIYKQNFQHIRITYLMQLTVLCDVPCSFCYVVPLNEWNNQPSGVKRGAQKKMREEIMKIRFTSHVLYNSFQNEIKVIRLIILGGDQL